MEIKLPHHNSRRRNVHREEAAPHLVSSSSESHSPDNSSGEDEGTRCLICYEKATLWGIRECGHNQICASCHHKMRSKGKLNCSFCKNETLAIVLSTNLEDKFEDFDLTTLKQTKKGNMYYADLEAQKQYESITKIRCPVPGCGQEFDSLVQYKNHLKNKHRRYICQVCVEGRDCLISELPLYTYNELQMHLEEGEVDKQGNITLFHPYCSFCKIHFYDMNQFVKHMKTHHETCHVCGKDHPHVWYNNIDELKKHWELSHYVCKHHDCLEKGGFTVFRTREELDLHYDREHRGIKDANRLLGIRFDDEDDDDGGGGFDPHLTIQDKPVRLRDKLGINFSDVFRKFDVQNIDMLPGTVVDYRMDYRYFLLASGKASTDLIGNKFQDGKDQENNQSDGVVYIEDLIPPARKYYSVKKYFNKLKRVHGDSKEEENQTPNESNTRKGKERGGKRSKKSSKVNSRTQQKIRLENLERAYRRYKDRDYSALSLFRDFQDILGVRYGIQAFWGLAVCHTSSHSKELHEVLRREILKMRFREPTSILSESKPAPYRRGDGGRDDRNNNKNKKKGKGKDNHPFRPQQAKFSRIYKELISEVDEHLLANRKDIPVLDERQLNQAISAFYALEKCDMLQSEKLKMYISPSSREEVQKMFFCPRAKVKEILASCKLDDLFFVVAYWRIIWLKTRGSNPGITPGFNGFEWFKEVFLGKYDFIEAKKSEYLDEKPKENFPAPTRARRAVQRQVQGASIQNNEMNFPTLGDPDPSNLAEKTLQERMESNKVIGLTATRGKRNKKKKKNRQNQNGNSNAALNSAFGPALPPSRPLTLANNRQKVKNKPIPKISQKEYPSLGGGGGGNQGAKKVQNGFQKSKPSKKSKKSKNRSGGQSGPVFKELVPFGKEKTNQASHTTQKYLKKFKNQNFDDLSEMSLSDENGAKDWDADMQPDSDDSFENPDNITKADFPTLGGGPGKKPKKEVEMFPAMAASKKYAPKAKDLFSQIRKKKEFSMQSITKKKNKKKKKKGKNKKNNQNQQSENYHGAFETFSSQNAKNNQIQKKIEQKQKNEDFPTLELGKPLTIPKDNKTTAQIGGFDHVVGEGLKNGKNQHQNGQGQKKGKNKGGKKGMNRIGNSSAFTLKKGGGQVKKNNYLGDRGSESESEEEKEEESVFSPQKSSRGVNGQKSNNSGKKSKKVDNADFPGLKAEAFPTLGGGQNGAPFKGPVAPKTQKKKQPTPLETALQKKPRKKFNSNAHNAWLNPELDNISSASQSSDSEEDFDLEVEKKPKIWKKKNRGKAKKKLEKEKKRNEELFPSLPGEGPGSSAMAGNGAGVGLGGRINLDSIIQKKDDFPGLGSGGAKNGGGGGGKKKKKGKKGKKRVIL